MDEATLVTLKEGAIVYWVDANSRYPMVMGLDLISPHHSYTSYHFLAESGYDRDVTLMVQDKLPTKYIDCLFLDKKEAYSKLLGLLGEKIHATTALLKELEQAQRKAAVDYLTLTAPEGDRDAEL